MTGNEKHRSVVREDDHRLSKVFTREELLGWRLDCHYVVLTNVPVCAMVGVVVSTKSSQIQIRVSAKEKKALEKLAESAGLSVSAYMLRRALPSARLRFGELTEALADEAERPFAFAELNDLLATLAPMELEEAVADADLEGLSPYLRNYLAAMVELASERKDVRPPAWTREVFPLEEPVFATDLPGLRLHLLRASPVAFKRRNIFVDASVGDRV